MKHTKTAKRSKDEEREEIERTAHGNNVADAIHEDDYGDNDDLTIADVWNILDSLHTAFMNRDPEITELLSGWMNKITKKWDIEMY